MSRPADSTPRKPRKFLPEPIEISSRSSKKKDSGLSTERLHTTQIHATPESLSNETNGADHTLQIGALNSDRKQRGPRKFAPQLMETARHSVRPGKKQSSQPDSLSRLESRSSNDMDIVVDTKPIESAAATQESRFSYSSLLRRHEARRHSFRVPDLPAIPSSCSEESKDSVSPSLPRSPSAPPGRRAAIPPDTVKQSGDGLEEQFLQYLLPFSLQPSETQLKEQALAAFPNEQVYQPVDHFAIDREEEEPPYDAECHLRDPGLQHRINRRTSSADLQFELEYLRRHKEEAGMNRRHYFTTRGGRLSQLNRRSSKGVDRAVARGQPEEAREKDRPLAQLRQAASPPMLGRDLVFPQSLTPATTISEDSRTHSSNDIQHIFSAFSGLWNANPHVPAQEECNGLWNGTCKVGRQSTYGNEALIPGLVTPRYGAEPATRKGTSDETPMTGVPVGQQVSRPAVHNLNEPSDETNQEFNDGFVTQIYNYLSLGYPSVARYYDYELSKVSGVPVAALRADDLNTDAKGHVAVHDSPKKGSANGACMRWTALRLYIREWARQQPQMSEADPYHETWGVRERKGSWAV
ncbi:hypothetical protein ASPCAL14199 [Aspergillus calidoustus]|uniref:Uncharacterized protein n=1 Tax=Aspergillus calidoustus TaxID=454130 RepID=A0A0U5HA97_ASPCI|nr:hypothetical protein ASPCAL14199 [Aspergillus calidoustus]